MVQTFYGTSFTPDDLELRALTRIHPSARLHEAELFTSKWWDYRLMHPTLATYFFAHCYEQAVKEIYAKTKDVNEALAIEVFKGEKDIFHRELDTLPFWRARQFCDRVGARYDFALRFAMNRAADRGWTVFPRPNQLYEETLIKDVKDAWEKHLEAIFEFAKHPDYKAVNHRGEMHQIEYREWLLERCATRLRPQGVLARCLQEGQLTEKLIHVRFGEDVAREAKRLASL